MMRRWSQSDRGVRWLVLAVMACVAGTAGLSQEPASGTATQELKAALSGEWTGVLAYRDYSEPAGSAKRVKLPTWLSVTAQGASLRFHYTYDDGPTKTVFGTDLVTIDDANWTSVTEPKAGTAAEKPEIAGISGLMALKNGRGVVVLVGPGTENREAVEVRTTIHVDRNLLEFLRETRPKGGAYSFRHEYTFVRSAPPPGNATASLQEKGSI